MTIATVEDVEALTGATLDPVRTTRLLELADGSILAHIPGLSFEVEGSHVVTIPGTWERDLWLPVRPATALTVVRVDGVLVSPSEYRWTAFGPLRRLAGHWGGPGAFVDVTYETGFVEPPTEFVTVAADLVRSMLENPGQVRSRTETVGAQSESVVYATPSSGEARALTLNDEHKRLLRRWKPRTASVPISAS